MQNTDDMTFNNAACCIPGGDVTKAVCSTAATPCDPDAQYTLACDESADCFNTGDKCWFGNGQSNCQATADDFSENFGVGDDGNDPVQVCKTNAECGTGITCALKTCSYGTTDDDDVVAFKLHVCGTPTNCK